MASRSFPTLALALLAATPAAATSDPGPRIAEVAERFVEERPTLLRNDCSGFVMTVLSEVGTPRQGGTQHFWQRAQSEGRVLDDGLPHALPRPGDLAFFDRTWDKNGNGRVDDELTHIAIVTAVAADGTVSLAHHGGGRIGTLVLNVAHPAEHKRNGQVVNSFLASSSYAHGEQPRLAGQLLRGFARPPGSSPRAAAEVALATEAPSSSPQASGVPSPANSSSTKADPPVKVARASGRPAPAKAKPSAAKQGETRKGHTASGKATGKGKHTSAQGKAAGKGAGKAAKKGSQQAKGKGAEAKGANAKGAKAKSAKAKGAKAKGAKAKSAEARGEKAKGAKAKGAKKATAKKTGGAKQAAPGPEGASPAPQQPSGNKRVSARSTR